MRMKIVVLLILVLSFIFTGCFEEVSEIVLPPDFRIMSKENKDTYEAFDRVAVVEITITNNGGDGSQNVCVSVKQGDNHWVKEQRVYLNSGDTKILSFRFKEVSFLTLDPWNSYATIE